MNIKCERASIFQGEFSLKTNAAFKHECKFFFSVRDFKIDLTSYEVFLCNLKKYSKLSLRAKNKHDVKMENLFRV